MCAGTQQEQRRRRYRHVPRARGSLRARMIHTRTPVRSPVTAPSAVAPDRCRPPDVIMAAGRARRRLGSCRLARAAARRTRTGSGSAATAARSSSLSLRPRRSARPSPIVFCDLKGSTELGDRLDSEALREVLALYFSAMKPVLERHGGTIEKYIGDAIMAVFGLPRMHEDDALRAVRAAAEMREALAELNVTLRAGFGVTLENRTGVNTGEVVTGDGGGSQRLATGDTVNVAARLEQAAPAGEILIGESTYRLVREAVEVVPVEPLDAERQAGTRPGLPVALGHRRREEHQTGRPAARRPGPRDRRPRRGVPPFGRRTRGPARHAARRGRASARAGSSRSSCDSLADEATVLRGRCLSYGDGITFWPLAEVLRQAAGIVPEDSEEDARIKLKSCFGEQLADATSSHRVGHGPLAAPVRKGRAVLGRAGGPRGTGPPQAARGGLRRHPLGGANLPRSHRGHPRRLARRAAPPRLRGPPRAPRGPAGLRRGATGGVPDRARGALPRGERPGGAEPPRRGEPARAARAADPRPGRRQPPVHRADALHADRRRALA